MRCLNTWIVAAVCLISCSTAVFSRRVKLWTFEMLATDSDLVVIARPIEIKQTDESVPEPLKRLKPIQQKIKFAVLAVLKGSSLDSLEIRYFQLPAGAIVEDGPQFFNFSTEQENNEIKDRPELRSFYESSKSQYLLFLKRDVGGVYSPTTGYLDSKYSFRFVGPVVEKQ